MFFIRMTVGFKSAIVRIAVDFSKGFDVFGEPVTDVAGVCPVHVCCFFLKSLREVCQLLLAILFYFEFGLKNVCIM